MSGFVCTGVLICVCHADSECVQSVYQSHCLQRSTGINRGLTCVVASRAAFPLQYAHRLLGRLVPSVVGTCPWTHDFADVLDVRCCARLMMHLALRYCPSWRSTSQNGSPHAASPYLAHPHQSQGLSPARIPRVACVLHFCTTQIFELDTFKVTHSSRYPAPVLSLGVSPDAGLLAVGMADGMLSIRKHVRPKVASGTAAAAGRQEDGRVYRRPAYVPRLTAANFRYFIRGQNARAAADDYRIKAQQKARLAPYDKLLRQFR